MSEAIPAGWASCVIGDIAYLKNGFAFKSKNYLADGIPVIRISDIQDGVVTSENSVKVKLDKEFECFSVLAGDVLIAMSGATTGKFGIYKSKKSAYQNQRVGNLKPRSKGIYKQYLFYFLYSAKKEIEKRAYGGAQPNISAEKIGNIPFSLPPLHEQHRIVAKIEELFSELDKGIENLKTAQAQLKVYRQAVLKHALEGKLTAQWREENKDKLESADQLLARIQKEREALHQQQIKAWGNQKKTAIKSQKPRTPKTLQPISNGDLADLQVLPENWLWEKLGWMTCGVEYGTSTKSSKTGDAPVIRMGNIQNAKIDWADLVYTSDPNEILKYSLNEGDVLFNRTNSPELVGKTAIYQGESPTIFAGYLIRVNHIQTVVHSQYLNMYLNSYTAKQHGNTVKTDGVNQSNINGEKLSNYPFPYCSLEEQYEVVRLLEEKISVLNQVENDIDSQLHICGALRQSILKKAFSGQLVAQDPNDEPASVLLERINAEKAKQVPKKKASKRKAASA